MKLLLSTLSAIGLLAAVSFTTPTLAVDSSWAVPIQCDFADTKTAHPGWYAKGGYCSSHYLRTDSDVCAKSPDPTICKRDV